MGNSTLAAPDPNILGESRATKTAERPKGPWQPVSDRKIRVGIVGYGVCQFGAHVWVSGPSQCERCRRQRFVQGPLR